MGYRGEDLDLRTPQTWAAGSGEHGWSQGDRGRSYGARAPIWVDETVLACANHAFDVALAHRAGEVRLEHLLYALTRIDSAAETLEKRGVRVASLRRETATVIASDIPVGLPGGGNAVPRRSEAFEEALRIAAGEAGRRNAPATADDLLNVLIDIRPDLPGLGLLARHAPRVARDIAEPLPHLSRASAYEPPRYVDPVEPVRERVRLPAAGYYVTEAARPVRSELAATTADTIQNSRIEALEQMVRALSHDLAGERKAFTGMLQDMQRDFLATRDDQSRLGGGLHDRLQSLEHLVTSSRGGDTSIAPLFDRLQSVEIGIDKRLTEITRTWGQLSERLQTLEHALSSGATEQGRHWSATGDKLKSLEIALKSRDAGAVDLSPISDRLDVIEEALLSPDRDAGGEVGDRLASIERLVQSQRAEIIAETEVLKADLSALAARLARQPDDGQRMQAFAGLVDKSRSDVVAAVSGVMAEGRGELAGAIATPLLQRINALAQQVEVRHTEQAAGVAQVSERLAAAERALTLSVQRAEESHKAYAQELSELHDALMKLNSNQHTLAGSIDQWRNHGSSELSLVAKRLEGLEREAGKPLPLLEQMSQSMESMHRITTARYHRRNRFWYWLLGTDDWVAASWPSQLVKLEAERSLVKGVRR
jgi:hypothetical protein